MARTTNSDTLPYVDSRYELSMLASQRVRDLNGGVEPVIAKGRDKLTVVALREIATGKLDISSIRHELVQSYKDTPLVDSAEQTLEVESTDPKLHEIDEELKNSFMEDMQVVAVSDTEEAVQDIVDSEE